MKSIKLFFGLVAALFMTVTSQMGAQIPYTVSSAPSTTNNGGRWAADTKWYFIQFPNRDGYHTDGYLATEGDEYINSNGQLLLNGTTKPKSSAGLWCIVGDETKGYSFYNRKTGVNEVLSMTQDGVAKVLTVGTTDQVQAFDYAASTNTTHAGKATFKLHGFDNYYWNNSDSNPKCHLAVWNSRDALSDAGSAVDVIAATYDELVEMGLKIKVSTESEKFYYLIKNKRSGKYASFNGTAGLSQVAFDNLSQSSIWYVEADGDKGGYKMHNLDTDKLVNGNTMDATGCTMYIEENILCPGYFCVSKNSVYDANCWDDANSHTSIGYYAPKPGDYEGTSWAFEEAYPSVAKIKLAYLLTTAKNSVGSNPGCYPQSAVDEAKAVFDNSAATEDQLTAALETLSNALILPVAGKYYTITSAYAEYEKQQGKTMSAYVDGTTLKWKATDLTDDSFYWEIYEQDGKYVFKNYATQTFISTYASDQYSTGKTPANNTGFTWFDGGICNVKVADGNFHTNGHNSGSGKGGTIIKYGSGATGASAWYIKEVKNPPLQKAIATLQAKVDEYSTYSGNKIGENPGQYKRQGHTSEELTQAIAAAQTVLDSGSEDPQAYNTKLETLENFTFVKNEMEVGAYYRLQNTARQTWASIEKKDEKMGTSRMLSQAGDELNPLQIWKLEKDGDNFFLVNVASGLYPQEVIGGSTVTMDMGAKNAAYKFTWDIYSEASESAMPVHRIYFGGRQVNVEENGNMNWWYAENARFYIWKVEKTDQELLELVNNWARDHYTASNAATKIDVTPGVKQVISPNEFAAPEVVNPAVDALHAYTGAANPTLEQAQALYRSYSIVNTYWTAVNNNGGLLSVPYTLKAKYGTLILPINYIRPEHVKLYSCEADVDGVLTLVEFTGDKAKNKPFIVEYTDEATLPTTEAAYTYQFIGYKSGAETTNQTEGWLTGVLEDDQYVPAGGFILAKKDGVLGFYQVGADNVKAAAKYKCYLQPTSQTSAQLAYFFNRDDATTAITNLLNGGENGKVEIYDLSGKRLNNLQKGVNIVNGKKIIVR